jgi:hypothetical protein
MSRVAMAAAVSAAAAAVCWLNRSLLCCKSACMTS